MRNFEEIINQAWNNKDQINSKSSKKLLNAISKTIDLLDSGKIEVLLKDLQESNQPFKILDLDIMLFQSKNLTIHLNQIYQ